jgi:4-amino-4-deoxy-L-arabinose transferase-like glycosyltransferase
VNAATPGPASAPERQPFASRLVYLVAAAMLGLHLVTNLVTPYGIHRDEFLYFAMGRHLRLWHMDFPPFIAVLSEIQRFILGDSLVALRFVPAVASTLIVVLAALLAREFGGGRFAQGFAALAALGSVFFQRAGNLFQPVILDALWWTLGFYVLARLCREEGRRTRWWILLGLVGGIGLLTKFSILFFGFGVLLALLATPYRRALLTKWPWVTLAIALAIGSPSWIGQINLGWPLVAQMQDLQQSQLAHVSVAGFLMMQLLFGPAMIAGAWGVAALLRSPRLRAFRLVGWTCVAIWLTLIVLHGKPYYVGGTYPLLFAAGAVPLEWLRGTRLRSSLRWAVGGVTALYGLVVLPLGVPILAPNAMMRYTRALGPEAAQRDNQGNLLPLPQDYADMLGWEDRVAAVAQAYRALSPLERARAVIIGNNYGEAGALEFYGPRYGLPPVVSAAGSFYFFGPGKLPGRVAVTLGEGEAGLRRLFDSVEAGPHLTNPLTVREERDLTVYICRGIKRTLQEIWPEEAGRQ